MATFFLDSEFTGLNQDTKLISLALVSESDTYFYAEFKDTNLNELSSWHKKNVLPHLYLFQQQTPSYTNEKEGLQLRDTQHSIKIALMDWLSPFDQIEIWADGLAYDWVLFCELFNGALNLPKNIFYLPFDLTTALKMKGYHPDVSRRTLIEDWLDKNPGPQHNALYDAMIIRQVAEKLQLI